MAFGVHVFAADAFRDAHIIPDFDSSLSPWTPKWTPQKL
jgi:hypothetical protein